MKWLRLLPGVRKEGFENTKFGGLSGKTEEAFICLVIWEKSNGKS